jgi:hypothetical protein
MVESYRAYCSDSYVNQKLNLKLDLPRGRETVLSMFERLRREYPAMTQFRRAGEELELDTSPDHSPQRWVSIRSSCVRSGVVNPPTLSEGYALHRSLLELTPYFLSISPLDVDYLELLYGFDLAARGNHDAIVADALFDRSPLASLLEIPDAEPSDCQPLIGLRYKGLDRGADVEAYFEVKTRPVPTLAHTDAERDPLSVYLTLRRHGPFADLKHLGEALDVLRVLGETLVHERVVPMLLAPLHDAIGSGP